MTTRYKAKMRDRVRVARTDEEHEDFLGAVGTVVGDDGSGVISVDLDKEIYGVWILRCSPESIRLEAE